MVQAAHGKWQGGRDGGVGAVGHSHSVSLGTGMTVTHDQGPACRHLGH